MRKSRSLRESSLEWIINRMEALVEASKKLITISDIHYPGHAWSVVKLILLGGWVHVYTTIIPKYFKDHRYIDLLAGSGTTYIAETGDIIAGSPFVSYFFAYDPFQGYYFIEKRNDRFLALYNRAKRIIGDKAYVLKGDCNNLIQKILPERQAHGLVFIDNEGFDVYWNTIEIILKFKTDALILFPTSSVMRVAKSRDQSCLDRFYGGSSWTDALDEEEFLNIYLRQLKIRFEDLRNREGYVSNIRVGTGQFYYDIILACKKGPYTRAWEYFKDLLDWKDPKIIKNALDILKGRATQIDWFLDLHEKALSLREEGKVEKGERTTLDNFFKENG